MPRAMNKRAAAAMAESRIKAVIDQENTDTFFEKEAEKSNDFSVLDFCSDMKRFGESKGQPRNKKQRRTYSTANGMVGKKVKRSASKCTRSELERRSNSRNIPNEVLQPMNWNASPLHSIFTYDSESTLSETELQRREHLQRRAARQVHSNRPMMLSRRMIYKFSIDPDFSPEYSPLGACRLSFL